MTPAVALLDANVLYPAPLRDVLLQLAFTGLYQARWSAEIADEWKRNLIGNRPELAERIDRTQATMLRAIPDAVVTVSVKTVAGNRVYVIGKVNHPGDFPLSGPLDVMQALSLAGGATPFADTNGIRVLRRTGTHQSSITFRYGDITHGRRLDQNILLQSGDTVVVP